MNDWLDIVGASGLSYRFRLAPTVANLPAMSGNFVFVRTENGAVRLVCSGAVDSLLKAGERWGEAVREHDASQIYFRLNLSWRIRHSEHKDIAARHEPPMASVES